MVKILVADDELDVRRLVYRILTKEGYEVKVVEDGEKAVELLSTTGYDLVILDVMMPNMHGLDVMRFMKKQEHLKEIPVLIFTALGTGAKMLLNEENQADDYIQKPFMQKEFLQKVAKLIGDSPKG